MFKFSDSGFLSCRGLFVLPKRINFGHDETEIWIVITVIIIIKSISQFEWNFNFTV